MKYSIKDKIDWYVGPGTVSYSLPGGEPIKEIMATKKVNKDRGTNDISIHE
jgi:hypothetical protein